MFINCPNCNALVATDLVTDLPPLQCPRCDFGLRDTRAPQPSAPPAVEPEAPAPPPPLPDPPGVPVAAAAAPERSPPVQGVRPVVRFIPLHEPPSSAAPVPPSLPESNPDDTDASAAQRNNDGPADRAPRIPTEAGARATSAAVPAVRPDDGARTDDPDMTLPPAAPLQAPVVADPPSAARAAPTHAFPPAASDVATPVPDATAPATPPPAANTPAPAPAPAASPSAQAAPGARTAPSFLRATAPVAHAMSPRERRVLRIAIPALALLLVLQLLLADRVRLAGDATWRPWVAAACTLARCALPPWHAPDAIALVQRDVRPHPAQSGVLQVSATLRNDAAYPQAWPMLLLTLSDVHGRPLGARWFAPDEYRPADAADTLAPGAAAAFRIDVVEPSPHTVAFHFAFG